MIPSYTSELNGNILLLVFSDRKRLPIPLMEAQTPPTTKTGIDKVHWKRWLFVLVSLCWDKFSDTLIFIKAILQQIVVILTFIIVQLLQKLAREDCSTISLSDLTEMLAESLLYVTSPIFCFFVCFLGKSNCILFLTKKISSLLCTVRMMVLIHNVLFHF